MRAILRGAVTAGAILALGATGVEAQVRVVLGVGAGTVSPLSKSNWSAVGLGTDVKSLGYNAQLMLGVQPVKGIWSVRLDGQYASLNHEPTGSDHPKDKLIGGNLDLVVHPGQSSAAVRPYILAGPSLYHDSYRTATTTNEASNTKLGFNGGAGLALGKSDKVWFFVEARYVYTKLFDTSHGFIPVTAGVRINTHQAYVKK
jgi:hypothetical protein